MSIVETEAKALYEAEIEHAIQTGKEHRFLLRAPRDLTGRAYQLFPTAFDDLPKAVRARYIRRASK